MTMDTGGEADDLARAYGSHLRAGGTDSPAEFMEHRGVEAAAALEALEVVRAVHGSRSSGRSLGPYRIEQELGRGAQGVVYRAVDTRLGRSVALKLLRADALESKEARRRFEREAEAAGRIDHPNVCTVYEAGIHDGQAFIAMQLAEGGSLADALRERSASTTTDRLRRMELIEQVALGLSAAHAAGLIHRDIKPGNILLTRQGSPVLVDFGLVRMSVDAAGDLTQTGDLRGTPAYMAPEQLRGHGVVDERTDIHALGVVAYEWFHGTRPFDGATWNELFQQILTDPPARPARCPSDLWVVLETALEKDPRRRYASVADFADDLRRARTHEPIRARPAGPLTRLQRWARRRPAAALAVFLLVVGSLAFGFQQRRAATRLGEEVSATHAARERADRRAYLASIRAADASLANLDAAEAGRRLADCPVALRGWEWEYLHTGLDESVARVHAHRGSVRELARSPDHALVASVGDDGHVKIWRAATGEPLSTFRGRGKRGVLCAAFSADGRWLATGQSDGTTLIRTLEGVEVADLSSHRGPVRCVGFTSDRRALLSGGNDGAFCVHDLATKAVRLRVEGPGGSIRALVPAADPRTAWFFTGLGHSVRVDLRHGELALLARHDAQVWCARRQGDVLLVGLSDGTARLIDTTTGVDKTVLRGHRRRVTAVAFLGEGRVATGSLDGSIRVWDAETGDQRQAFVGHVGSVRALAWIPETTELFSGGDDGHLMRWLVAPSITHVRSMEGEPIAAAISFHPDGRTLAVAGRSRRVYIHDAWTGDVRHILRGHGGWIQDLAHTPDGTSLIAISGDGCIYVWDLASRTVRHRLGGGPPLRALALHPGGRELAVAGDEGCVRTWNVETGRPTGVYAGAAEGIAGLAYGPSGRLLAIGRKSEVVVLDMVTRAPLFAIPLGASVLAFSPDGAELTLATGGHVLEVYACPRGDPVRTLRGHGQRITSLAFHPDGGRLATGSYDQTVRLWDTQDGSTVSVLRQSTSWIRALAWSAGGEAVAAAASDRSLVVWHARRPEAFFETMRGRAAALRVAAPLIEQLYATHETTVLVVKAIHAREDLTVAEREAALHLAQGHRRRVRAFTRESSYGPLLAIRQPSARERKSLAALERELTLGDPGTWTTLAVRGLASQRLGDLPKALAYHGRSAQAYTQSGQARSPQAHLAHALALHAHGDLHGARAEHAAAEAALAKDGRAPSALVRSLAAEVGELVQSSDR